MVERLTTKGLVSCQMPVLSSPSTIFQRWNALDVQIKAPKVQYFGSLRTLRLLLN